MRLLRRLGRRLAAPFVAYAAARDKGLRPGIAFAMALYNLTARERITPTEGKTR